MKPVVPTYTIVPLAERHRDDWDRLFSQYLDFYKVEHTPASRALVWGWIFDATIAFDALVAETADGHAIGFAHCRAYPRPHVAKMAGFLDDLFVPPELRGGGLAEALIAAVADHGRARGWATIRWLTRDSNYRARSLYDRVAVKTALLTYEMTL